MTREILMEETLNADASMLLEFIRERTSMGDTRPITTREALEAIHRPQPADSIIPQEAAHIVRVTDLILTMLPEFKRQV